MGSALWTLDGVRVISTYHAADNHLFRNHFDSLLILFGASAIFGHWAELQINFHKFVVSCLGSDNCHLESTFTNTNLPL